MTPSSDPRQIPYAPRTAGISHRRVRLLIVLTFAFVIAFASFKWQAEVRRRITLLRWQHAAMRYEPSANHIAFDEAPSGTALLADGSSYTAAAGGVGDVPAVWSGICAAMVPARRPLGGLVVLHAMKIRGDAHSRLVAVEVDNPCQLPGLWLMQRGKSLRFTITIFEPGSFRADPVQISQQTIGLPFVERTHDYRISAGHIDARDPSHFTFAEQGASPPAVVEGWLSDDGSHVDLEVHGRASTPFTPPVPASAGKSH